jgi:hypothetical protein
LNAALVPDADLHELGIRFLGVPADTPRIASDTNPNYAVGTRRRFQASNVDTDQQFEVDAILVYKTDHLYMWVEEGVSVDEDEVKKAADLFENQTYSTNREFFGEERSPGVDGDPHLSILHAGNLGATVAGYFSSPDQYVQEVRPDSNEMEMFYINIDNVRINSDFYNGVLAHEFQHMIHWNNDRNEETWLNEGCSELAMVLNDRMYKPGYYDVGGSHFSYLYNPDTQLNSWPEGTAGSASANYGAAYLFMEYFLDRFGEEATQSLVAHPENGTDSVDATLQALDLSITHKELFADWIVTNLLDDASATAADANVIETVDGRYHYSQIDLEEPQIDESYNSRDYPVRTRSTVHQYGVDYIEIEGKTPLRFSFTGSTDVGLLNTSAYSGEYLWWSNRADESDTRLTRVVDLTRADTATLTFQAWYHIEENWDYAYVIVGTTDSGVIPEDLSSRDIQWTILEDESLGCTWSNPNGNSFGCALTGQSAGWETLEANLTPYTGQEIALRFEYITDAAVNQPGFALDDIQITVDGDPTFTSDVEIRDPDWIAEGFVRHANVLPQEWIVQVVTLGRAPQVKRLLMPDDGTQGEWIIALDRQIDHAVIVVSALAPVTTEVATYEYTLTPEP